jgi:hypothetical protein
MYAHMMRMDAAKKSVDKIQSTRGHHRRLERFRFQIRVICRRVFLALMAQFDVHRDTGKHTDAIPFVVVVQIIAALDELFSCAWN